MRVYVGGSSLVGRIAKMLWIDLPDVHIGKNVYICSVWQYSIAAYGMSQFPAEYFAIQLLTSTHVLQ